MVEHQKVKIIETGGGKLSAYKPKMFLSQQCYSINMSHWPFPREFLFLELVVCHAHTVEQ